MAGIDFFGGFAGSSSADKDSVEVINFDSTSTFPLILKALTPGDIIELLGIRIIDAFSYTNFSIGFPADQEEIAAIGEIPPGTKGIYEFLEYRESTIAETLTLYKTGVSAIGSGLILIQLAKI